MVGRSLARVLVGAFALPGCYDLERLDPGPESHYLLIDDFEDGDAFPSVSEFSTWRTIPFNYDAQYEPKDPVLVPGYPRGLALRADFTLSYPGNQNFTGVDVGIFDAEELLDLRVFRSIHFSARFDSGDTSLPTTTRYNVQFGCNSAPPAGIVTAPFWVQRQIPSLTREWQTFKLSIADFDEQVDMKGSIKGGLNACLGRVDNVRFNVSTNNLDEQPVTASLYVDDVSFD